MARLAPTKEVIRRLFAYSGNICAFPECNERLIDVEGDFVGQICHIEAAEPGGERYNDAMTDEDRRSYENLLLLCYKHHVKTDDVIRYPVVALKKMKGDHEARFTDSLYGLPMEVEEKLWSKLYTKLEEIHSAVIEHKSLTEQNNNLNADTNENTKKILALLQAQGIVAKVTTDDTKIYSEQLKFIKNLRENGKSVTALEELLKFKEEKWANVDDELKYKILANIASILFDLSRKKEAGAYLRELNKINYRTSDSLAYLALGYAIENNADQFNELIKDPLLKDSKNVNLWIAYAHLFIESKTPEEIREVIPQEVLDKPEMLFTLGEMFVEAGDHKTGFAMLDRSLQQESDSIEKRYQTQGIIAAKKLLAIAKIEKVAFRSFSPQEIEQIKLLINDLTESWKYIAKTELAANSWHIIMNRGVAYKIIGDTLNAEKDLETAWQLSQNFICYRNLAFEYFDTLQFEKAERLVNSPDIEKVSGFNKLDYVALKARFYYLTNIPEKANELLREELIHSFGHEKRFLLDLIIVGYFENEVFESALPFVDQLITEFPDESHGYIYKGTCLRRMGKEEDALPFLKEAYKIALAAEPEDWVWYQLGDEFYALRHYSDATECYKKIYEYRYNNKAARKLILASFFSGNYEEAEGLCIEMKKLSQYDVTANEVLFRIYDNTSNDVKAVETLENYLSFGEKGSHDHFRLLGIKFYRRRNDLLNLKRLLLDIENPGDYSLQEQFIIAKLHFDCGEVKRGLDIAYEARVENFEKSEAHEGYVSIGIGKPEEPEQDMFPHTIGIDTAVGIMDGAKKETIYFITDDNRITGATILRSSNPLAKMLMTKTVGEQITMENSVGIGNTLTVNFIIGRNVFAFRESLKLLETKFAGQTKMLFFQAEEGAGANMLKDFILQQSIELNKKRQEIFRLYNSGATTIGMLAKFFGQTMVEMWMEMIYENQIGIQCYEHDESLDLLSALSNNCPAVIETTALLTIIGLLDKPELLENLGLTYYVSAATLEEVLQYRQTLDGPQPKMTVGVQDGELRKSEISLENVEKQKAWLDQLVTWCKNKVTIQAPKMTIESEINHGDLEEMIGQPAYHSLKLSKDLNAVLISDDAKLKALAAGEFNIRSFSSYQAITQSTRDHKITPQEFADHSRALAKANYIYIPISGEDLWLIFEESGFRISPVLVRGVRGLRILNVHFAAKTIVTFAKKIYLNVAALETRDQLLQLILRTVKPRLDFDDVRNSLLQMIDQEFYLLPTQKKDFKEILLSM